MCNVCAFFGPQRKHSKFPMRVARDYYCRCGGCEVPSWSPSKKHTMNTKSDAEKVRMPAVDMAIYTSLLGQVKRWSLRNHPRHAAPMQDVGLGAGEMRNFCPPPEFI